MNIKHGVLNNLYKIIKLQLHKNTLMNQMHIHGSCNLSYKFVISKNNSKWVNFYMILLLILYVFSILGQIIYIPW
jgi:hypothetical protein